MKSKEFIGALFLGVGIGAVLGVLIAPENGKDKIKKLSQNLKSMYNQFKGNAEDIADNLKVEGKNFMDKSKNIADDYMDDGEEKLNGLKSKFDRYSI